MHYISVRHTQGCWSGTTIGIWGVPTNGLSRADEGCHVSLYYSLWQRSKLHSATRQSLGRRYSLQLSSAQRALCNKSVMCDGIQCRMCDGIYSMRIVPAKCGVRMLSSGPRASLLCNTRENTPASRTNGKLFMMKCSTYYNMNKGLFQPLQVGPTAHTPPHTHTMCDTYESTKTVR